MWFTVLEINNGNGQNNFNFFQLATSGSLKKDLTDWFCCVCYLTCRVNAFFWGNGFDLSCVWSHRNPFTIHSSKQKSPIVHQDALNVSNRFSWWLTGTPTVVHVKISASKTVVKCIPGGGNIDSNLTLLATSQHRHNTIVLGVGVNDT